MKALSTLRLTNYSTILFDADDTLFDFRAAEKYALSALFAELGMTLTPEIAAMYAEINGNLRKALEQGSIMTRERTYARFTLLFERLGMPCDGVAMNDRYLDHLAEGSTPFPCAEALCRELHQRGIALDIVTNGITRVQTSRLERSVLRPYIRDLFISEAVGAAKPAPQFFDHVLECIPEKDKSRILLIGDSLTSDIRGADLAGLDSVWVSREPLPADAAATPTWQVPETAELLAHL